MILGIQQEGSQQPQAPPQVQPQPQYPQYPPETQVPAPTRLPQSAPKSNLWIIILAIVIVVVVIVLAAFLYLLTCCMPCGGRTTGPQINLSDGEPTGTTGEWKIEVAGVSSGEALASYNVVLLNGTHVAISSRSLDTLESSCYGFPGIAFQDVHGDSKLNLGDWFIICGTDSSSDYQVQLFWKASNNKVSGNTGKIEQ